MKIFFKIVIAIVLVVVLVYFRLDYLHRKASENRFIHQLGKYQIDLKKTIVGESNYDLSKYADLEIVFRKDSTFELNKDVPFFLQSKGEWLTGDADIESWNTLFFKNISGSEAQFSNTWSSDSIFYIKYPKAKYGSNTIPELYFKKIQVDNER